MCPRSKSFKSDFPYESAHGAIGGQERCVELCRRGESPPLVGDDQPTAKITEDRGLEERLLDLDREVAIAGITCSTERVPEESFSQKMRLIVFIERSSSAAARCLHACLFLRRGSAVRCNEGFSGCFRFIWWPIKS